MDQDIRKNGLVNLVVFAAIGVSCLFLERLCMAHSAQTTLVFLGLGVLVTAVGWFQMRLDESSRLEALEFEELKRSSDASALFSQEVETFPAARARDQFNRWLVPAFSVVLLILQGTAVWWFWTRLAKAEVAEIRQPAVAMSLYGILALVLFLIGKYSAGLARIDGNRLLRPGASHLLLGAYLLFAVTVALGAREVGFPRADLYVAKASVIVLGLTALENLVNLILEIYRPRVKGQSARLLYESRLIGLLGQPEGLITTAAQALDYQFGFKVSETWFYRFLEKALAWIILLQLGVLCLSTAFVVVEPQEEALIERFGQPVVGRGVLGPGFHLKFPWPIDKVYRYRTREVQTFMIGAEPDADLEKEKTVVWTKKHYKEEFNLLVASRDQSLRSADTAVEQAVPVNLLTVSIPIQYRITNLIEWAYGHGSGDDLLRRLAAREVVRYLVNVDIDHLMGPGRVDAGARLRERIQASASQHKLGAEILLVGMQDIHPPIGSAQVKVAEAYEAVIGALQERETNVLAARAYWAEKVPMAHAEATNLISRADGERSARISTAAAESALFAHQMLAYQTAPEVYSQRTYLETLTRATATSRKYVIGTTNTMETIWLNLEDKIRTDLLDVTLPQEGRR